MQYFAASSMALKVAFLSNTGQGNEMTGKRRTDWYGNEENAYDLNGEPCVDYKGECK